MADEHVTASVNETQPQEQLGRSETHQSARSHFSGLSQSLSRPIQGFPGNCGRGEDTEYETDEKTVVDEAPQPTDDLTRSKTTQSVAERLPLPREIAFVVVICMAQLLTRECLEGGCRAHGVADMLL